MILEKAVESTTRHYCTESQRYFGDCLLKAYHPYGEINDHQNSVEIQHISGSRYDSTAFSRMMKLLTIVALLFASYNAAAGVVPGDVNMIIQNSDQQHSYKFRLIVNNSTATSPTACAIVDTGTMQTLPYGAIGISKAKLTLQAADCDNPPDQWFTLKGSLDYDSNYWYELYVDMLDKSFFL